ncbi:hypothetical protein VTI74DRAFT_8079 [Chaetomium olivicolor]
MGRAGRHPCVHGPRLEIWGSSRQKPSDPKKKAKSKARVIPAGALPCVAPCSRPRGGYQLPRSQSLATCWSALLTVATRLSAWRRIVTAHLALFNQPEQTISRRKRERRPEENVLWEQATLTALKPVSNAAHSPTTQAPSLLPEAALLERV